MDKTIKEETKVYKRDKECNRLLQGHRHFKKQTVI